MTRRGILSLFTKLIKKKRRKKNSGNPPGGLDRSSRLTLQIERENHKWMSEIIFILFRVQTALESDEESHILCKNENCDCFENKTLNFKKVFRKLSNQGLK